MWLSQTSPALLSSPFMATGLETLPVLVILHIAAIVSFLNTLICSSHSPAGECLGLPRASLKYSYVTAPSESDSSSLLQAHHLSYSTPDGLNTSNTSQLLLSAQAIWLKYDFTLSHLEPAYSPLKPPLKYNLFWKSLVRHASSSFTTL